jgi:uncharacterized membrane protein YcaP (DUF421 family)
MLASLFQVDWSKTFLPSTSPLEIIVRGTTVYLTLFFLLRIVLKRQSGTVGITDLLVIVLIADAAQNAMAGSYLSVCDGLLLVGTIVFWSYALDWLGYYFPRLGWLVHPPPLLLVRDGQMLRKNMRLELITKEELMSQLREQGVSDLSQVKAAYMEGDGHISVIQHESPSHHPRKKERSAI